jgi:hypothetical protein
VAGAAHRRFTSTLKGLECGDPVSSVEILAVAGLDQLLEHIVQTRIPEIPFSSAYPFLPPEMGLDYERLGHGVLWIPSADESWTTVGPLGNCLRSAARNPGQDIAREPLTPRACLTW